MGSVWFTADLHLGHGNIIKHCLRPFLSPAEEEFAQTEPLGHWKVSEETRRRHDDALLTAINDAVRTRDTLWVLGDFCWGGPKAARAYRERIRCQKVNLVWGCVPKSVDFQVVASGESLTRRLVIPPSSSSATPAEARAAA